MITSPRLYFASKLNHAALWRDLRDGRLSFCTVICSWIDTPEVEDLDSRASPACYGEIWQKNIAEAAKADFTLLYWTPTDRPLVGALVECGATLAMGGTVIIIGEGAVLDASWTYHPRVIRTESFRFDRAIQILQRCANDKVLK